MSQQCRPLTVGQLREFLNENNIPNDKLVVLGGYVFCMNCAELYLDSDGDLNMDGACECEPGPSVDMVLE